MTRRQVAVLVALASVVVAALGVGVWAELRGPDEVAAGAATAASSTTVATTTTTTAVPTTTVPTPPPPPAVPEESGEGHRVVFSVGGQRMWWVDGAGEVVRTSLVSGREATPELGTFAVYSKTEHATGLDGSKMDHFVRFTKGPNGWAIGFHGIPTMDGVPVQTEEQLGTPLSHGCIRQKADDAAFTWEFLDVGSTVVVVA